MRRAAPILLLALAAALPGCGAPPPAPPPAALVLLPRGAPSTGGGLPEVRVEVAADTAARERGLMGRSFLLPDEGMLFVYPEDRDLHFWMKNCPIPLSAAFLDSSGRILNIVEMAPGAGLPEEELPRYDSEGPARCVLEMEGGWFVRRGVGPGDRVDMEGVLRGVVVR